MGESPASESARQVNPAAQCLVALHSEPSGSGQSVSESNRASREKSEFESMTGDEGGQYQGVPEYVDRAP